MSFSLGKVISVGAVVAVIWSVSSVYGKRLQIRTDTIESLCYDVGELKNGLRDAVAESEPSNGQEFLALVPDDLDGRSIEELIEALDDKCYDLGLQNL